MSIKNLNTLSSMLLLLLVSTVSANTANANTLGAKEQPQSPEYVAEPENYLLSQALGHYEGGSQMNWSDYKIGKINTYAGDVLSVSLIDERTSFNGEAPFNAVSSSSYNVLVVQEGEKSIVLDFARPRWIGTLLKDYGFSIEKDRRSDPPLQVRTEPLWRQLGR
ncbi:MAG: hypothetical protein QNJ65_18470 [Xenococcaceae cyanobacterium MO_234.B1]|nr:hypothetical protein [Xenococcaceae cyanobacterium MO_234.B1]